ncbi:Hypothetical protein PHPALM_36857 [Phytophthora palmivora]|uniref:RxLR effector protein n=1 Tax=Phytophthora palmivora TaxID=4796 RepID=A0A2P4WYW2_9STRA|nr:Hypothetical protein PHPALM_36857 [Phytophthora palmivora]
MRLLHLVLVTTVAFVCVSNGITVAAKEVSTRTDPIHDTAFRGQPAIRKLTSDEILEERRGGGGGGGGGHGDATGVGPIYGTHTSIGLMNTNHITHDDDDKKKKKKKCNRFFNWWKRLFNPKTKRCPKEEDEDARLLPS